LTGRSDTPFRFASLGGDSTRVAEMLELQWTGFASWIAFATAELMIISLYLS
jgi:hypothetical protein